MNLYEILKEIFYVISGEATIIASRMAYMNQPAETMTPAENFQSKIKRFFVFALVVCGPIVAAGATIKNHSWLIVVAVILAVFYAVKLAMEDSPTNRTRLDVFVGALKKLLWVTLSYPVVIVILGIATDKSWLLLVATLIWGLATISLALISEPLAIFMEKAISPKQNLGIIFGKYIKIAVGLLTAETLLSLCLAIFPVKNNLGALPIFLLASITLGYLWALGAKTLVTKDTLARWMAVVITICAISFFLPRPAKWLAKQPEKINQLLGEKLEKNKLSLPTFKRKMATNKEGRPNIAHLPRKKGEIRLDNSKKEISLELSMLEWSEQIILPPHTAFRMDAEDEIQGVQFWDGKIWERETFLKKREKNGWLGGIEGNCFRFIGTGKLVVSI